MKREFLKNFQVNGQPLPDAVIDAIMQESEHDLEAAKANPGVSGGNRRQALHTGRSKPDRL